MSLMTREEYIEELKLKEQITTDEWNKPLYKCPRCNGEVKRDYSVTYMTNPPKYRYFCKSCTFSEVM
jgi:transposase-like protein